MSEEGVGAGRGPCLVCGRAGGLACSRCRGAHYCGPEHQRQHWPQHRAHCTACFEVRTSPELGRHLVATRDIPKGTVIIKEKPLAVMPRHFLKSNGERSASCANCCRLLPSQIPAKWAQCGQCGVPLCSEDCCVRDRNLHTVRECAVLQRVYARERLRVHERLQMLGTLRCLSLTGAKAKAFRSLANSEDLDRPGGEELRRAADARVEFIRDGLMDMFQEEDVRLVQGVLLTNAFCFISSDGHGLLDDIVLDKAAGVAGNGLYDKMSLLQHSCLPNAKYDILMKGGTDFTSAIIAEKDIPAGCGVSVAYVNLFDSTFHRRAALFLDKNFLCHCQRCEDPSELGFHVGSMCCRRCKLLGRPMSVLEATSNCPLPEFRCKACGLVVDVHEVNREYEALSASATPDARLDGVQEAEDLLQRAAYPNGLLHPTAGAVLRLKYSLVKLYGQAKNYSYEEMPDALLARKLSLCQDLQPVMDVLAAGYSDERCDLLVNTAEVLLEMGRRSLQSSPTQAGGGAEVFLAEAEHVFQELRPMFIQLQKKRKQISLEKQIADLDKVVRIQT